MANSYKKISDTEIERTTQESQPAPVKATFDRKFLEDQKKAIKAQKDAYVAQRDVEIAEVDEILAEMDKLGITSLATEGVI